MLSATHIDVWLVFDAQREDQRLREYAALLAPDEIERARKFRDEARRQQFVVTRALTRIALSNYAPDIAPEEWRFATGARGKPVLAAGFEEHSLHFNAAHTTGLVALAVAREPDVGVDVENLVEGHPPLSIASRYFDADEVRDLEQLPVGEKRRRFYALWTLKESWLKATGRGLADGLGNISFALDAAHRARRVTFATETPGTWRFWQAQVSTEYLLAIAIHSPQPVDWTVRLKGDLPDAPPAPVALPAPRPLGDSPAGLGEEQGAQA
jgi:4'-phosphopantetheinyl transferase